MRHRKLFSVTVRFTRPEREELMIAASRHGMNVSEYVRLVVRSAITEEAAAR